MEKWEYITRFVYAHIDNKGAKDFLPTAFPNKSTPWAKYAPETMIPTLNLLGEEGWEVIHMEPIPEVGSNADVGFPHGGANITTWSNVYFCVLKRKK